MNGSVKYYGNLAPVQPVHLSELAANISRECTVTVHDVKAVLSSLEEQIYMALRNGQSVRLGDLGSFRPVINTTGVEIEKDFSVSNIKTVRPVFTPSTNLRYNISKQHPDVSFLKIGSENSPKSPEGSHTAPEGSHKSPEESL